MFRTPPPFGWGGRALTQFLDRLAPTTGCSELPCMRAGGEWKRLNQTLDTTKYKYCVSQEDMYQMFAYGQRYLNGKGLMVLIYPKTRDFFGTLPEFEFSKDLRLWAVAFDLERGMIVEDGLPEYLKPVLGLAPWADLVNEK